MSGGERDALSTVVAARVLRDLQRAPITPRYSAVLRAALALPGNILSRTPDVRWARPACICCAAAGGDAESDQVVKVAAAIEVHMGALDLFDDVEDGERCELLTTYGLPATVNAATGLIYLAQQMLLRLHDGPSLAAILVEAGLRATAGQHADLILTASSDLALDMAMEITAGKSGSLMAGACRLGAAAAGADVPRQNLFARFGSLVGIVAQLANDIAALGPHAANKTDRALLRPTLPLVYTSLTSLAGSDQSHADREAGAGHFAWAVAVANRALALDLLPALTENRACQADLAHLLHPL